MDGGLGKRLFWIVLFLLLAVAAIATQDLVLGLDLQGGVTMRYELEPPETATEIDDLDSQIQSTIETLRARLDSFGIKELSITRQGDNELIIELPGSGMEDAEAIAAVVSRVGHLEWRIVNVDDVRHGITVAAEREKLVALLTDPAVQGLGPDEIDVTSLDQRFDDVVYRWVPYSDKLLAQRRGVEDLEEVSPDGERLLANAPLTQDDYFLVKMEKAPDRVFTGADVERVYQAFDRGGAPAVGVALLPSRSTEFGDFTEEHTNQPIGILLDGRIAENPANIEGRLEGSFVIHSGNPTGFSETEIRTYLTIIRSGSLQLKPKLMFRGAIGPSLGESSIEAGLEASVAAFLAILVFMLVYYRMHGAIASVCLIYNLVLLAGLLMALQATLTLPGLAGLVLTLGMAVDANILIFERLREESDASKSLGQSVKLGFDKALSTILDANITTFVTAAILYGVGTGPVRGFAVVLMLGILTSVFSVLVLGRTLYEIVVERGSMTSASMGRMLAKGINYPFMGKANIAMRLSVVMVVAALIGFGMADRDKYGLDFLGGYKAQVRLLEPSTQAEVKAAVDAVFPGAQVISVVDGASEDGGSSQFVIKIKSGAEGAPDVSDESTDLQTAYQGPLMQALAGMIRPEFVTDLSVSEDETTQTTAIAATVHFEGPVTPEQVRAALDASFGQTEVTAVGPSAVHVTGTVPRLAVQPAWVSQHLHTELAAATDLPPTSTPFEESTTIGGRVGTELRDSAGRAILLSFLAIVIYIRLRFREYRYGWAAIIALAHDVCVALGAVTAAHYAGFIDVEIDLAMVAAFLTIIGYSLNDTIVLFDRVRENLPRMQKPFGEVLNISINQTLARTLLTSLTTLVALGLIFVFNFGKQNVLEGFAFAMMIGVLVGTYSSIFIAAPVLTMLTGGKGKPAN